MRTREIGHAAFAMTRMRFVRALLASALVNAPLVLAAVGLLIVMAWPNEELRGLAGVVAASIVLAGIAGMSVALNAIDRVHRRLSAFLSIYASLLLPLTIAFSALTWARSWNDAPTGQASDGLRLLASIGALAVTALALVLFVELTALAIWTTLAPKGAYLSVRGWRPGWPHPIVNFTHQLGFPVFAAHIKRGRSGLAALYFLIALLNVVFFGLLSAPLWLPRADVGRFDQTSLALLAIPTTALLLMVLGVGRLLDTAARRRATNLYQDVREWDDRPPVLFLRSFDQDKLAIRAETHDPVMQWPPGLARAKQLDEVLLEAGAPFGPVIAIGDPRDPIPPLGAARVFVRNADQDWKNVVADLIAASRAIVICPQTSAGVVWEIEQVQAPAALAKCIVLASPDVPPEDTCALFERVTGDAAAPKRGQRPVAAFLHPNDGWTLLTARRLSMQTYSVALNRALQCLLPTLG